MRIPHSLARWRFVCSLNNHISPPQLCWLLNLEVFIIFWACNPIFVNTQVFLVSILETAPYHIPLNRMCPNKISSWIRHVLSLQWLINLLGSRGKCTYSHHIGNFGYIQRSDLYVLMSCWSRLPCNSKTFESYLIILRSFWAKYSNTNCTSVVCKINNKQQIALYHWKSYNASPHWTHEEIWVAQRSWVILQA